MSAAIGDSTHNQISDGTGSFTQQDVSTLSVVPANDLTITVSPIISDNGCGPSVPSTAGATINGSQSNPVTPPSSVQLSTPPISPATASSLTVDVGAANSIAGPLPPGTPGGPIGERFPASHRW